jgi:hypothetical protein
MNFAAPRADFLGPALARRFFNMHSVKRAAVVGSALALAAASVLASPAFAQRKGDALRDPEAMPQKKGEEAAPEKGLARRVVGVPADDAAAKPVREGAIDWSALGPRFDQQALATAWDAQTSSKEVAVQAQSIVEREKASGQSAKLMAAWTERTERRLLMASSKEGRERWARAEAARGGEGDDDLGMGGWPGDEGPQGRFGGREDGAKSEGGARAMARGEQASGEKEAAQEDRESRLKMRRSLWTAAAGAKLDEKSARAIAQSAATLLFSKVTEEEAATLALHVKGEFESAGVDSSAASEAALALLNQASRHDPREGAGRAGQGRFGGGRDEREQTREARMESFEGRRGEALQGKGEAMRKEKEQTGSSEKAKEAQKEEPSSTEKTNQLRGR